MIQYLIFGILFFKILFLYLSRRSSRYHQSFFYFRFSSRKSQIEQKLAKKITHFTIQFCSKNLTYFTNLNSLDTENNMLPQHSQKPFWLYKFSANMFLFGVRNNICTAPFLDTQELHSWSTLNANVCIFLYISLISIYLLGISRDVVRFYLVAGEMKRVGSWIIFLKAHSQVWDNFWQLKTL